MSYEPNKEALDRALKGSPEGPYVISVGCTWHGPIQEVALTQARDIMVNGRQITSHQVPCCPHCASMLMQNNSREEFDSSVQRFANDKMGGDPQYAAWIQSLHDSGTCRPLRDWDWRADFAAFKADNQRPYTRPQVKP